MTKTQINNKNISKALLVFTVFLAYTFCIPTFKINLFLKLLLDILLVFCFIYVYLKDIKKSIINTKKNPKKIFVYIFSFWLLSFLLGTATNMLIKNVIHISSPNNIAQYQFLKQNPLYLDFSMLVFSPLVEELAITVSLKKIITNKWLYLIMSSLFFGMFYVIFSATNSSSYLYIISYTVQSFIWIYAYCKTDNIVVPIGIHFLQNIITFLIYII